MKLIQRFTISAACAGMAAVACVPAAEAQVRGARILTGAAVRAERGVVEAQVKRAAFEQSAMRTYAANVQSARAAAGIRQQVVRAESVARAEQTRIASQSLKQRFSQVNNPGVVYLRHNKITKQHYVGQSKDTIGYLKRQASHDRAFRRSEAGANVPASEPVSEYTVIGTASPVKMPNDYSALSVAEETAIRYYQSAPGVSLSNARHQMSASNYSMATGGHVSVGGHSSSLGSAFAGASGGATLK